MAETPDIPDRSERGGLARYESRYKWFTGVVLVAMAVLFGRLWYLQVVEGNRYHRESTENIVRTIDRDAPRGRIFDREGIPLATNRTSYEVRITPHILRRHDVGAVLQRLQKHLNLSDDRVETLEERLAEENEPMVVAQDVSRNRVAQLETDKMRLPGTDIQVHSRRHYPLNAVLAHTVGYTGEITGDELDRWEDYGYEGGDFVGKMGLERAFEAVLKGSPGEVRRIVNAKGIPQGEQTSDRLIGSGRRVEPIPGRDLELTVDAQMQLIIDRQMEAFPSGAVVAVDPENGDILAMYSKPHFNPNSWSGKLSEHEKMRSDNDPFKPMLDKTVRPYFPGSVFKIAGAYAALDTGVVEADDEKECPGYSRFGGRIFRCWQLGGHGDVDLVEALMHSCDVYFYKLAADLGQNRIAEYAFKFGFGEKTGVPHNREQAGQVPTEQWHEKHSPNGYQEGFALNLVLGQGNTMATPTQVAMAYAAVANGGSLYYPRIVRAIRNGRGDELFRYPSRVRKEVGIESDHLESIRDGLWRAVNEEGGTAYRTHREDLDVAGKTGTAQVHSIGQVRVSNREKMFQLRDHAWFVGYAPSDDPEVVLAVFLEHAGHGGRKAAPVAMDIFESYFENRGEDSLARKIGSELERGASGR